MKVFYSRKFLKELANIPQNYRTKIEEFIFHVLPSLENIYESNKVEALTEYRNYYKVRFGNYRVGLKIHGHKISVERVLHRKDIYKYFP